MNREIKHRYLFTQSPMEVWEYLTRPELLELWLMKTDFQLKVGHKFSCINKAGKTVSCEVLEFMPNELLIYSWRVEDINNEITVDSTVTWTLAEKDGGTELLLKHSGFMISGDFTAHSTGWTNCLNKLKGHLNIDLS